MRILAVSFLVAACGAAPSSPADSTEDLTVAASIGPQSFTHGTLSKKAPQLAYAFVGTAGDVVAPDAWPTGKSALKPSLALLGPKARNGHRPLLAAGTARGADPRHVAIDGFRLPKSGS